MLNHSFTFFVVPHEHPKVRYQHESVSLCEGLIDLGYACAGSAEYWRLSPNGDYLLKPQAIDSSVHIYNVYYFRAFPEAIHKVDYTKVNVLIDREDGIYGSFNSPDFKKFDLILRTHYNQDIPYHRYHHNIKPWAFGLSNRIINTLDTFEGIATESKIGQTYRLGHELRDMVQEKLSPQLQPFLPVNQYVSLPADIDYPPKLSAEDQLFWLQSGHRHDPDYFKFLHSCAFTYAFGGFFYPKPYLTTRLQRPLQAWHSFQGKRKLLQGKEIGKHLLIDQYDSWRWWEALYSNSVPLHLDFGSWGWVLPEQPINGTHYLGVHHLNFESFAQKLRSIDPARISYIATEGRKWAKKHYSPVATAHRFIQHLDHISG